MAQRSTLHWVEGRPAGRRILVVDGDTTARVALAEQLARHFEARIDAVGTGAEALALIENARFQMLLVEGLLPDMDGRELCRTLRERRFSAPIIVLSAGAAEADAILALDAGADDFVAKPCHLGLLLARLRAHLRQFERSEDAVLPIGHYAFDYGRQWLTESDTGHRIALSAKEAALLKYLYLNRGKPADVASIKRDVWGYRAGVESHTAETHIYRLRRKIEPDPAHPRILLRVAGGYRLACVSNSEGAVCRSPLTKENIEHRAAEDTAASPQRIASSPSSVPIRHLARSPSHHGLHPTAS
jgi:DNA-binding response OmpR family regulator